MKDIVMFINQQDLYKKLQIKHKKIYILGLGITGKSALNFFSQFDLIINCWDDNINIRASLPDQQILQYYRNVDFQTIDFIILSPGISLYYPKEHYILEQAKICNIPIYTDIEIFMLLLPKKKYIGVTGTNGKSTVVSLLQHVFLDNNIKSVLAGNIGMPALDVINLDFKIVIFELSSFQLEIMSYNNKVKFNTAIFLNFSIDHIMFHGTLDNYFIAKTFISKNQNHKDTLIINKDVLPKLTEIQGPIESNLILVSKLKPIENIVQEDIYYTDQDIIINGEVIWNYSELKYLKGEHNAQNMSFVISCARLYGIPQEKIVKSIATFKGLSHRQEFVVLFKGITFINDSKSTTIESTIYALKAFTENVFLILGGYMKSDNIDELLPYLKKVSFIFLVGLSENIFASILEKNNITTFLKCHTIEKAINSAYDRISKLKLKNATILLSPACASFDQYQNFMERGNSFKHLVEKLVNNVN